MLFHNDSLYIAHHLLTMGYSYRSGWAHLTHKRNAHGRSVLGYYWMLLLFIISLVWWPAVHFAMLFLLLVCQKLFQQTFTRLPPPLDSVATTADMVPAFREAAEHR